MLVTINTDASFHPLYKNGAYAYWIVCNNFKTKEAGFFVDKCKTSHEAEMKAILNALTVLLSTTNGISRIIINTDSMNSISVFTNDKVKIKRYRLKQYKKFRVMYHSLLNKYKISSKLISFRHAKAHSGLDNKRSYVNEWCDVNAKRYLWRQIHSQIKQNLINFLAEGPSEEQIEFYVKQWIRPIDKRSIKQILK